MGAYARATGRSPGFSREQLIRIISSEYREMPGMRLTRTQFRRLWNLGEAECDDVVRELVGSAYLTEGADGRIGRRDEVR